MTDDFSYSTSSSAYSTDSNTDSDSAFYTQHLIKLCLKCHPQPQSVQLSVEEGADVCAVGDDMPRPVLHHFICRELVECVEACMQSPNPIDFTAVDKDQRMTPLHMVCLAKDSSTAESMLRAIVDRVRQHPDYDLIDWSQWNADGHDFLSVAAKHGVLHVVWPLVKELEYFSAQNWPLVLTAAVRTTDVPGQKERPGIWYRALLSYTEELFIECSRSAPAMPYLCYLIQAGGELCRCTHGDGMARPVLHHFIWRGLVECVEACMQSPNPIDFTAVDRECRMTPFHLICLAKDPCTAIPTLQSMVDRLQKKKFDDQVNWLKENADGHDFLSMAAHHGVLHVVWPVVKELEYFSNHKTPFVLTSNVERDDWNKLDRYFQCCCNINFPLRSSTNEKLKKICRRTNPSSRLVRKFVRAGADVCAMLDDMRCPVLHHFILRGHEACVQVCMQSPNPIDFTAAQLEGDATPLHLVCLTEDSTTAESMLRAIVDRVGQRPGYDPVDWEKLNADGLDFLSMAASRGMLHVVWPLVSDLEYFRLHNSLFTLTVPLRESDWSSLEQKDRGRFTLECGFRDSTDELIAESNKSCPTASAVRELVDAGADVCTVRTKMPRPALHEFIGRELVECVEACMQSPKPIDFTVVDRRGGMTPLHHICLAKNAPNAIRMLRAIVDRIQRGEQEPHPTNADKMNWSQENADGHGFLSLAASRGLLRTAWRLVSELEYFRLHYNDLFALTLPVSIRDKNAVQQEYSGIFSVKCGFRNCTFELIDECTKMDVNVADVRVLVDAGANVCVMRLNMARPSLHQFLLDDRVECVEACMQSPNPIDFTSVSATSWMTPFHFVCVAKTTNSCARMLCAMVQRLSDFPGKDHVKWSQKNIDGDDFLSLAASQGILHVVWPAVRTLEYFKERSKDRGIVLTSEVESSDREKLPVEDRDDVFVVRTKIGKVR